MKVYLASFGAGLLMGLIYYCIDVPSPAPPGVALTGLLGMLIGGQLIPIAKRLLRKQFSLSWFRNECALQITGVSPLESRDEKRMCAHARCICTN